MSMMSRVGFLAFIIGLVLAVIGGFLSAQNTAIVVILVLLGLIIGLLNISAKEIILFLVATIALIVAGGVFAPLTLMNIGKYLDHILGYVATLMAPAAVVVAIKALWAVGKPGD
jgi:hypothetical protein